MIRIENFGIQIHDGDIGDGTFDPERELHKIISFDQDRDRGRGKAK